jgi:hypothetical protein
MLEVKIRNMKGFVDTVTILVVTYNTGYLFIKQGRRTAVLFTCLLS